MANSKRKPKDTDCKNWLDRKQSNKKERQYSRKEEAEIVRNFTKRFVESQQDMPRDIAEIVQKHFWELI